MRCEAGRKGLPQTTHLVTLAHRLHQGRRWGSESGVSWPRGAGQVGAHCPPLAVLKSFLPAPRPHPKVLAELALGRCPLRKPAPKRGARGTWGPSTPTCLCKWGLWGPVRGGIPQQSLVCKGLNLGLGYAEERVTKHTALWSDHLGRSPGTCPVTRASHPPR